MWGIRLKKKGEMFEISMFISQQKTKEVRDVSLLEGTILYRDSHLIPFHGAHFI